MDEAIARRLGMNVRTCRAHIAKLAAALGSESRAQLGYPDSPVGDPRPGLRTVRRPDRPRADGHGGAGRECAACPKAPGEFPNPPAPPHSPRGQECATVILLHCMK